MTSRKPTKLTVYVVVRRQRGERIYYEADEDRPVAAFLSEEEADEYVRSMYSEEFDKRFRDTGFESLDDFISEAEVDELDAYGVWDFFEVCPVVVG